MDNEELALSQMSSHIQLYSVMATMVVCYQIFQEKCGFACEISWSTINNECKKFQI